MVGRDVVTPRIFNTMPYSADNADVMKATIDGKNTLYMMGIIIEANRAFNSYQIKSK